MKSFLIQITCIFACLFMLAGCGKGPDRDIKHEIYVTHPELNMMVGEEWQITASPTDQTFTWESTNPEVASVNATGLVRALKDGVCFINVTSSGGLKRSIPVDVRANIQ